MPDGQKYDVIYASPRRGKRMVHGRATRETLGYIEGGSLIRGVDEADIAADPGVFIHADCQKPFAVKGNRVWCPQCTPGVEPQRNLRDLTPRPASERINVQQQMGQQPHPNFQGMQKNPWGNQQDTSPRQQPNYAPGTNPADRAGTPVQPMQQPQAPTLPPAPAPVATGSGLEAVRQERLKKEQSMGIPVHEPPIPQAPPALAQPSQTPTDRAVAPALPPKPTPVHEPEGGPIKVTVDGESRGVNEVRVAEFVDNKNHVKLLEGAGYKTLYDVLKADRKDLVKIKGIANKSAIVISKAAFDAL